MTRREAMLRAQKIRCDNPPHGHARRGAISPTYYSWLAMRGRCLQPKDASYCRYGARGITICERWNSFESFLADMGERPVGKFLDRIDNDGNYEPGNCKWSTRVEQMANTRVSKKTEFSCGHPKLGNTYHFSSGHNICKICAKERARVNRLKRSALCLL